jgi:hypothetical protein
VESPGDDEEVVLEPRSLPLPFGELVLTSDPAGYFWGGYRFNRFIPVGEFVVRGFSNRYRQAGVVRGGSRTPAPRSIDVDAEL